MLKSNAARTFAAFATTIALAGVARADLKLEQTVTTTGASAEALPQGKTAKPIGTKVFTYYKGEKQRIETPDSIVIYDGATDTTLFVDPKRKTYYEQKGVENVVENEMMKMVNVSGEAIVAATGEEKNIAGKPARRYTYSITLKLVPKDPNAPAALAAFLPSQIISGDLWTVDVPDAAAAMRQRSTALLKALPPGSGEGLASVIAKMGTIKGVSLDGTQTARTVYTGSVVSENGAANTPPPPVVTQTVTTRISEDALPDSYFSVPSNYKKTLAPMERKPK